MMTAIRTSRSTCCLSRSMSRRSSLPGSLALTFLQERMAKVIHEGVYADPIRPGLMHRFAVGAAPKSGSGGHVTVMHEDMSSTLPELVCQPFQRNFVRAQPLAAGMATAKVLENPDATISTKWDHLMPEQMDRVTTLVVASICGVNTLFDDDVDNNPDGILSTDDGVRKTRYVRKQRVVGTTGSAQSR